MPQANRDGSRRTPVLSTVLAHTALIFLSAVFLVPLLWLITSSLKTDAQIFKFPPEWIPNPLTFENYPSGLTFIPFWRFLLNTSILCVATVLGTILSCSLVAYGLARINWRGRNPLLYILLGTMMLPFQVTMVPVFVMFARIGWVDTLWPLIIPHFFGNAFYIFLMRQFISTFPNDLIDAARIDGAPLTALDTAAIGDLLAARAFRATEITPGAGQQGFLYFPLAEYDSARAVLTDAASEEDEGVRVEF
jgi:multiple sugar transport system permease protein